MDAPSLTGEQIVTLTARICLGIILLTSGLGKLRDLRGFTAGIRAYDLIPAPWTVPIAVLLPALECLLALMLLADVALPIGALASAGLLLAFSAAVAINLRRGRRIACHCHGLLDSQLISWGLLARNALLLMLCGLLIGRNTGVNSAALTLAEMLITGLLVGWCFLLLSLVHHAVDVTLAVRHAATRA
jgi:uncharacterized membrane protein YphA (DoxX/SURF4 family)